jgi:hypothetical protein
MRDLATQRCFNHATREAVACCPQCGGYFCRECITEHDGRVICAACLRQQAGIPRVRESGLVNLRRVCQCGLGLLVAWFFFYLVGESLLSLPAAFHERTLWKANWLEKP